MLRKIPFLSESAEIVYTHQEHFDGSGYPNGLRATEIPIGARIFAVADTLDAITSDRPYREARSFDAARERYCAVPAPSSIPQWSRSFSRFPTNYGTNSVPRSPARTSDSPPSTLLHSPTRPDLKPICIGSEPMPEPRRERNARNFPEETMAALLLKKPLPAHHPAPMGNQSR